MYNLYRRYYQSEKVYYNELQIIAKNRKLSQEQENEEWIPVGKQSKKNRKANQIKYNFLEDKKRKHSLITVIWRAENW